MVPVAKPEMHLVMSNRRFPADRRLETHNIKILLPDKITLHPRSWWLQIAQAKLTMKNTYVD